MSSEGVTRSLGPDWRLAPDGIRERDAARVVLLDGEGRALLVRGHDVDQPERSWWFTLGGGIDPGETALEAALREVREEAGLALSPGDLVGPVLTRTGIFDFFAETCRQREVFFLARLPGGHTPDRSGWTDVEREVLDDLAWLSAEELRAQPLEVFPHELPEVLDVLVAGWDGTVRHLGVQDDN
ncbi:NUDIX hydrolase [Myceligenerans salitolerans]|uniref:NUDIX domain-containing protein n=1 Tax=Myceligenerans salitolerans TaxID=1230528 RepID=A0ABS3ICD9_9MICO|nr:NUDIX domain-containing protein [Myceligenerans salitolerans]MBO0610595.1 NUDIX domain-containing protein [Myceligenerans salitolerans]